MRARELGAWGALVAVAVVASCGTDRGETPAERVEPSSAAGALTVSPEAHASIESLRQRFRIEPTATSLQPVPAPIPLIGRGVATSFEANRDDSVGAVIPPSASLGVRRPAHVDLPKHADAMVRLEDQSTHVSVGFALRGAVDSPIAIADGIAIYTHALAGSDVIHRVHAEGTEDFVVFEERPAREEIAYDVDVSRVAGLRLVGNTLEFLDQSGTPVLRVAPPYVVDANGSRHEATLAVDACAVDVDSRGPWGRAVTRPGAASCGVRVTWGGDRVVYPAMVDPVWETTGSMATARAFHTATLLTSGQVLVVGGGTPALSSAELFNPTGAGTFAATGSMATARYFHTATRLVSGKVLVAGGNPGFPLSSAELYDPGAGSFAMTGAMPTEHCSHTATLLGSGKVLIAGGINASFATDSAAALFDSATGSFASIASMTKARDSHTATVLVSGKVLIAGGNGGSGSSAELFDGTAFTATGPMTVGRAHHTATLLASGKVLIAGGNNGTPALSTAELFDGTATFAATGSMASARYGATATLVANGVLIAGGYDGTASVSFSQLFDGTATFTNTASMTTARDWHTATQLLSGPVLVTGGQGPGNINLSSAEIFENQPAGGSCANGNECISAICNENCCSGTCSGVCMTCAAGTGACSAVKSADDPNTCTGLSTCDASGACKLKTGQTSVDPTTCASGFASDGFCCDTACVGGCDVCAASLGAKQDGTCTIANTGYAGNPMCGSGLACDGASSTCPTSCITDVDCLVTDYCGADAICHAQKTQGVSCDLAVDCKSPPCGECITGHCADGVCCNSACDTLCVACTAALKQSGATDGVCDSAKAQTNPHNDTCPIDLASTCGHDGQCDGSGACSLYYPPGTSCGDSMCNGTVAKGMLCDGAGTCATSANGVDCDPYLCSNGSCSTTCTQDADCATDAYCNGTQCAKRKTGPAQACTTPDQCASGYCADGYCCNAACQGQCEACNAMATKGTCTPVVGTPVGSRLKCAPGDAQNPCGATSCNGTIRTSCKGYVGALTACGEASCSSEKATLVGECDGTGTCKVPETVPCGAYACGATACNTTCASDTDCASTSKCDVITGKCVSGATCGKDGHTATGADGIPMDCAPYNCQSTGACRMSCSSVDDCVAPNICNSSQQCVAPASTSGDSGDSGGCSITATSNPSPSRAPTSMLTLGLCIALLRRRRPRAPNPDAVRFRRQEGEVHREARRRGAQQANETRGATRSEAAPAQSNDQSHFLTSPSSPPPCECSRSSSPPNGTNGSFRMG